MLRRCELGMLELDDIQHFLLTRTPALAARYEFLTLPAARRPAGPGSPGMIDKVGTGARRSARASPTRDG